MAEKKQEEKIVSTPSDRARYQREYYKKNKEVLETKRALKRQREPRMCLSCHNAYTPMYARQRICTTCAAHINKRSLPPDATPEELRVFHLAARVEPRARDLLAAGFAKKKNMAETVLRMSIAIYSAEEEAATWEQRYYLEVAKRTRGAMREEMTQNAEKAEKVILAAREKLKHAHRSLEIHNTLSKDGKFTSCVDTPIETAMSGDASDLTPDQRYRKLLQELDEDDMI